MSTVMDLPRSCRPRPVILDADGNLRLERLEELRPCSEFRGVARRSDKARGLPNAS